MATPVSLWPASRTEQPSHSSPLHAASASRTSQMSTLDGGSPRPEASGEAFLTPSGLPPGRTERARKPSSVSNRGRSEVPIPRSTPSKYDAQLISPSQPLSEPNQTTHLGNSPLANQELNSTVQIVDLKSSSGQLTTVKFRHLEGEIGRLPQNIIDDIEHLRRQYPNQKSVPGVRLIDEQDPKSFTIDRSGRPVAFFIKGTTQLLQYGHFQVMGSGRCLVIVQDVSRTRWEHGQARVLVRKFTAAYALWRGQRRGKEIYPWEVCVEHLPTTQDSNGQIIPAVQPSDQVVPFETFDHNRPSHSVQTSGSGTTATPAATAAALPQSASGSPVNATDSSCPNVAEEAVIHPVTSTQLVNRQPVPTPPLAKFVVPANKIHHKIEYMEGEITELPRHLIERIEKHNLKNNTRTLPIARKVRRDGAALYRSASGKAAAFSVKGTGQRLLGGRFRYGSSDSFVVVQADPSSDSQSTSAWEKGKPVMIVCSIGSTPVQTWSVWRGEKAVQLIPDEKDSVVRTFTPLDDSKAGEGVQENVGSSIRLSLTGSTMIGAGMDDSFAAIEHQSQGHKRALSTSSDSDMPLRERKKRIRSDCSTGDHDHISQSPSALEPGAAIQQASQMGIVNSRVTASTASPELPTPHDKGVSSKAPMLAPATSTPSRYAIEFRFPNATKQRGPTYLEPNDLVGKLFLSARMSGAATKETYALFVQLGPGYVIMEGMQWDLDNVILQYERSNVFVGHIELNEYALSTHASDLQKRDPLMIHFINEDRKAVRSVALKYCNTVEKLFLHALQALIIDNDAYALSLIFGGIDEPVMNEVDYANVLGTAKEIGTAEIEVRACAE